MLNDYWKRITAVPPKRMEHNALQICAVPMTKRKTDGDEYN